jgi:predicted nucleic acid-binding protein
VRAVVDTNVIADFLLGTEPFREECERFWRDVEEPIAPASWEAEIANVLWMATRRNVLELPEALHRLDLARSLLIRSIASGSLWHGALVRAHASGVAAYDTLRGVGRARRRSAGNLRRTGDQSLPSPGDAPTKASRSVAA